MYAELHARSAFSFLQGASQPEALVEKCAELEVPAVAQLDLNSIAGIPRFYKAAEKCGIKPIMGAEVRLWDDTVLPLIIENQEGYQNLCKLLSSINLRTAKGEARACISDLEEHSGGLIALAGGSGGGILSTSVKYEELKNRLGMIAGIYGNTNVFVELQRHFLRRQEAHNQRLIILAEKLMLPKVATNGAAYAGPESRPLFDTLTCIKNHVTIEQAGRLLSVNSERYLKPAGEMSRIFADVPEAFENINRITDRADFKLENLGYIFPRYPLGPGENENDFLRHITQKAVIERYGENPDPRVRTQIEKELYVICKLGLAGYFLIVWDIINFCRRNGVLAQGRGSAANSAVCYSLGITAVDPIAMDLLFERFLSEERGEYPDIDIDLPSGEQRESVIQHVYEKYGERGAAMTSVVITYQGRSAAREVGKVLGFPEPDIARLSKLIPFLSWKASHEDAVTKFNEAGFDITCPRVRNFIRLFNEIQELPRHLGQHPGGMVISQHNLGSVVPLEPAAMPGRVILQWDKDDCADLGIIKVDLLGLGMLAVIQETIQLIDRHHDEKVDLAKLPPDDPAVYKALKEADTVGWFQVESRAQMSSLPRTKPLKFYDLVVQVAIIRPGPIVGDMAAPYIRRRLGLEEPDSMHPLLEKVLARTLGVPLFQEQLLRMAMVIADFTGGEAEQLRRALGSKRSKKAMVGIEEKLRKGMTNNRVDAPTQDRIVKAITSFALYGFPESHAASFALLSYASGYLKIHYLAAYMAAMLNNQPMGFYSPAVLIKDAQRHGQRFLPIDVNRSDWECTVEEEGGKRMVRLGLMYVRSLSSKTGRDIAAERDRGGFYTNIHNLKMRLPHIKRDDLHALAKSGALNRLDKTQLDTRAALWASSLVSQPAGPLFANVEETPELKSPLTPMNEFERINTDLASTGLVIGKHPVAYLREQLRPEGVTRCLDLMEVRNGRFAKVIGSVVCRQRPGTAKGIVFLSLEDESGIINVVVMPDEYERFKLTILENGYLLIKGTVQSYNGSVSLKALWVEALQVNVLAARSHDFH
jgi:error-prone DNA polymerase